MNFIKCHTITDAPPVTLDRCPSIILTADGGLYADVTISGKPTRLRFSDIISVSALPSAPQANRLYALRNTLMYAYNDSWITLATTVDVNTIAAQMHELISAESQARNEAISEAVTSINSGLEANHEVLRQEITKEVATAKGEAIADAEAKNAALHTTITEEIATAKAGAESVASADATAKANALHTTITSEIATAQAAAEATAATALKGAVSDLTGAIATAESVAAADAAAKANAAQRAAESTAAATLALTEAKLSKKGEVAFTAENTIRGAISAVDAKFAGKADLDETGKVPASQLPSYIDDVVEVYVDGDNIYADAEKTEAVEAEDGKIYVDLVSNKTYRWSGSVLVEISQSLAIGETAETAFAGNRGKALEEGLAQEISDRSAAVSAINAGTVILTGYTPVTESDVVDLNTTDSVNVAFRSIVSHLNTLDEISGGTVGDLTGVTGRITAVEGEVDVLQAATVGFDGTTTVAAAIATAKGEAQSAAESTAAAALAQEVIDRNAAIKSTDDKAVANATAIAQEVTDRQSGDANINAKLSKEGEVPFTAEATVRGAISAVEQALEELRSELPGGGTGSGESTCNFTPELAEKLAGIESEAQKNVIEGVVIDGVTIEPENKLVTLANVAATGDYADLQNRPTDLGEFTNTPGYLTASDLPTNPLGPTKLSELENDTGFITSSSSITGNAATADKLNTARTITIAGAVAGSVQFDGSSDVTLTVTLGDDIKIDASDITGLTVDYADIKNTPEVYTKTEIDNLIGDLETELDEI